MKRVGSLALVSFLGATTGGGAAQSGSILWLWQGIPTTDRITIKAAVNATGPVVLRLNLPGGGVRELHGASAPAPHGAAPNRRVTTFLVDALIADGEYTYTVSAGSWASAPGRFRTAPPEPTDLTVAFASCAKGDHEVFSSVRALNPDFFIHMGDLHYANIGETLAGKTAEQLTAQESRSLTELFALEFDRSFGRHQRHLFSGTPVAYVWDDHDYGPNNSGEWSPTRIAAGEAYRLHVPADVGADAIHQTFDRGPVRFIFTDNRSHRSKPNAPSPTMLGQGQKAWLLDQLRRASSDRVLMVVWVNSVPWITNEGKRDDGWREYQLERTEIAAEMERLGLAKRTVILSGDAHMLAVGERSNYATGSVGSVGGPLVLHAAPLNNKGSVKGGPYKVNTPGTWLSRKQQFGLLKFRFSPGAATLEFTGLQHRAGAGSEPVNPAITASLRCDSLACTQ